MANKLTTQTADVDMAVTDFICPLHREKPLVHVFVMPVDQVDIVQPQLENNVAMIGVACWSANAS